MIVVALNPKQRQFVAEYLVDGNATQAAIRSGYSKASAYAQGCRLLKNAEVRKAIDEGREVALQAAGAEAIAVIRELLAIGRSDVGDLFDEEGRLLPLHKLPAHIRKAISSFEVEEMPGLAGPKRVLDDGAEVGGEMTLVPRVVKVKLWDKNRALEMLGRHKKLFTDKVEVSADSSFADLLKAARERANRR